MNNLLKRWFILSRMMDYCHESGDVSGFMTYSQELHEIEKEMK